MKHTLNPESVKFAEEIKRDNPSIVKWLNSLGNQKITKERSKIKRIIDVIRS